MPELPEVETVVRSIARLKGRRIVSAEFTCLRVLRLKLPDRMAASLAGRKITGVKRYGKFILASLDNGAYLMIHLGMTGKLLLGGPAGKHTHAILTLDRGVLLYDDSLQFGCIRNIASSFRRACGGAWDRSRWRLLQMISLPGCMAAKRASRRYC